MRRHFVSFRLVNRISHHSKAEWSVKMNSNVQSLTVHF